MLSGSTARSKRSFAAFERVRFGQSAFRRVIGTAKLLAMPYRLLQAFREESSVLSFWAPISDVG